jgi:DNA-directed RNA polymerase
LDNNIVSILISDEFYLHLGSYLVEIMGSLDLIILKVYSQDSKSISYLTLADQVKSLVGNNINRAISIPFDLPMIVKPKSCSQNNGGGYWLNNVDYYEPLINDKLAYGIPSKVSSDSYLFSTINSMMSVPYRVNKELLNYLIKFNHIHKLLFNSEYLHELASIDRDKYQEREYQKLLSIKLLEEYIIKIASTFASLPEIYFPIKMDQRGRLYPRTVYFHYQGSELAKALLQFAIPDFIKRDDINAINYLKVYGANCFGNGLNRKSFNTRLNWVNKNWAYIIDFENNDLVDKANSKFLFLAFCFEMRRFDLFLNNVQDIEFKTYMPIQLDGTCNGFQHLAMLANETDLFDSLNLYESDKKKDPKDFYTNVLDQLNVYLKDKYNETTDEEVKKSYSRLLNLGLNRNIIKPAIMNKPYNATTRTLTNYVKYLLEYKYSDEVKMLDKKGKEIMYKRGWYSMRSEALVNLQLVNHSDIELLVKSIENIIYVKYPKIKELNVYLRKIVVILNKLNLPVFWKLPTGLVVSQNYLVKKFKKVEPFTYLPNSITITTTIKGSIDKNKQITAFMPNLVHSLDSTALCLLYSSFNISIMKEKGDNVNFYSVHDCYGVTAKYAELLINILRSIYIKMYSDEIFFIKNFDEDIINFIISSYGVEKCSYNSKERILIVDFKEYKLPQISNLIEPNDKIAYEKLSKAQYFIN